jgi:hypothetical protein
MRNLALLAMGLFGVSLLTGCDNSGDIPKDQSPQNPMGNATPSGGTSQAPASRDEAMQKLDKAMPGG